MHKVYSGSSPAVAGVIEALLMVALVAIVLFIIQSQYIPQLMNEREAEHMDLVSNQFSTLKSTIDLQAITQSDAPFSSMLMLGSRQIPYFITAEASGRASVQETNQFNIRIDFGQTYGVDFFNLTAIMYEADNAYFVDQTYALEGGGIIVMQPDGQAMITDPSITVINASTLSINWDFPIIVGVNGKDFWEGSGKCLIRTRYSSGETKSMAVVNNINITTQFPDAWNKSLSDMLENNVIFQKGSDYVKIIPKRQTQLTIDYYFITTQIGPGSIKEKDM